MLMGILMSERLVASVECRQFPWELNKENVVQRIRHIQTRHVRAAEYKASTTHFQHNVSIVEGC